jgi:hypothetical protein
MWTANKILLPPSQFICNKIMCTSVRRRMRLGKYLQIVQNTRKKYEGALKSSRRNNEKNEFIISKLFLFFNIIFLKTNTFIPVPISRPCSGSSYYLQNIPLQLQSPLGSKKKNADQQGTVRVLGRDRSQREPDLGNRVDVPTVHSAYPLIFPLPKHFCGWVHCPDER